MNTFTKQPAETYTIRVDCTGKLPTGATISTGVVAALDLLGTDVSGTVLSGTSATIVGDEARIKVLAGTHGQDYRIRFRLTLSNADVLEEDVVMEVRDL
jgi:hypothetical protein